MHFNASSGRQIRGIGTEVLYYDAKDLAAKVSKAISFASGLIDRGAKQRRELSFLANTNKPAILLEICFVNSTVDTAIYNRDFEKICQAIAKELATAVGKTLSASNNTSGKYEVVEDENSKVWRIQSGAFKSKEYAIKAFEKSGLSYATIKGSTK